VAAVPRTNGIDAGLFANGPCRHDLHGPIVRHTQASRRALEDHQVLRGWVAGPDPCPSPDGSPAHTLGHWTCHVHRSGARSSRRRLGEGRSA
jgi:hypothetical protein